MNTILIYISAFINVAVFYVLIKLYKKIRELEKEVEEKAESVLSTNEIVADSSNEVEEVEEISNEVEEISNEAKEISNEVKEISNEAKESFNEVKESLEVASLPVAGLPVAGLEEEKNDVNTWHTIENGLARYKGELKNGMPNGKGIKHFFNTDSYIDGNFVDGFAEGYGKQTFEQTWERMQPYYEGEFKRNSWNGKGEYHYGTGRYYKGEWKDGKYHGQGAEYSHFINKTWVGEFENDEKVEDNGNWVNGEI